MPVYLKIRRKRMRERQRGEAWTSWGDYESLGEVFRQVITVLVTPVEHFLRALSGTDLPHNLHHAQVHSPQGCHLSLKLKVWLGPQLHSALTLHAMKGVTLSRDPGSAFQIPCQHVSAHFSCANTTGLKAALETRLVNNPNEFSLPERCYAALCVISAFQTFNLLAPYWYFFVIWYSVSCFKIL